MPVRAKRLRSSPATKKNGSATYATRPVTQKMLEAMSETKLVPNPRPTITIVVPPVR